MVPNLLSFPPRKLFFIAVFSLALLGGSAVAHAEAKAVQVTPQNVILRTGEHKDFDRLAFDGPRGMAYSVRRDGSSVAIEFGVQAAVNLGPAAKLTRAKDFSFRIDERDGKPKLIVSFSVAADATVKDFISGSSVVIDISRPSAVKTAATPEKASSKTEKAKAAPAASPAKSEAAKPAAAKKEELPIQTPPGETLKTPEKTQETKTEPPVAAPAPSAPPAPETAKPEPPQPEQAAKEPAPVPEGTPVPAASKPPEEAHETKLPPSATQQQLPAIELGPNPELVLTLDPKAPVGAAIFARGGYVNILFDRKITMDSSGLTNGTQPRVALEPIELLKNNGYRFALPAGADVRATRDGTAWKIFLVRKAAEPAVSTSFSMQPDFALGARVLLPTTDAPEPVKYADPVVGDELVVVPLRETSAFSIQRRMADFIIIPAAQGMVIKPLHEKVTLRAYPEGVEVTAEGGLRLSPSSDTGVEQRTFRKGPIKSRRMIFDFSVWRGKKGESFTEMRRKLMQTIVDVPPSQRNLARLELARFYFAYGMGEETLALLSYLTKQAPEIATHPEFVALRGAANILVGRAQEAMRDLNDPSIATQIEIQLWQAVGSAQLRDWTMAEEKFNYTEDIWNLYPEPFHSRFAVLAIEAALSIDKDQEASEWLDRLEGQPHLPEIEPSIKYLRGVVHSKSGRIDVAEKLWREVTRSNDRLYKIRAELALIDLGVATRSMTPVQAIERLEGLRYAWRGDDLELDILRRLGGYYIETKDFKKGLAVLQQGTRLYPNSSLTPPIKAEMAKTFHDIYLTDLGENMSPVEALTMYQDYRDLIPQGEEGNALKRNLAERLVSIDLLEQAANLLDEQLKNGLKGEERMRVGARLAAIRLLDQKPEAAIATLDSSQAEMPDNADAKQLLNERRLLRARALSQQGKYDAALGLLENNESVPARILKADITMRAQRWPEAAKALLEVIGPPPKAGDLLTEEQAGWLVNCAIALSLAEDRAGIDRLAIDYGAAMAGTSQKDMFRVLTRPDKSTPMKDIAAAQSKIAEVDMFRGFLDTYRGKPSATDYKDEKKK